MNKLREIESKVEEALNSFEGALPASPGPFFFTRVQARLQRTEENTWEKITAFVARPAVAFTVICLVILMNTLAIFQHVEPAVSAPTYAEQTGYEEFNLASNSFYEYEIKEP